LIGSSSAFVIGTFLSGILIYRRQDLRRRDERDEDRGLANEN